MNGRHPEHSCNLIGYSSGRYFAISNYGRRNYCTNKIHFTVSISLFLFYPVCISFLNDVLAETSLFNWCPHHKKFDFLVFQMFFWVSIFNIVLLHSNIPEDLSRPIGLQPSLRKIVLGYWGGGHSPLALNIMNPPSSNLLCQVHLL